MTRWTCFSDDGRSSSARLGIGAAFTTVTKITLDGVPSGDSGDDTLTDGYVAAFVAGSGLLALAAAIAVVMTGSRRARV